MFPTKILSSKELRVLVRETTQTRRLSGTPRALSPGIPTRGQRCVTFSNILKKTSGVSSSPGVTYLHILRSPTSALLSGKPRTGLLSPEFQLLMLVRMRTCILTMAGSKELEKIAAVHSLLSLDRLAHFHRTDTLQGKQPPVRPYSAHSLPGPCLPDL